jgi:hypothetical protein
MPQLKFELSIPVIKQDNQFRVAEPENTATEIACNLLRSTLPWNHFKSLGLYRSQTPLIWDEPNVGSKMTSPISNYCFLRAI